MYCLEDCVTIEHMFDSQVVSRGAGLEHQHHDYESELEIAPPRSGEDTTEQVYERHQARVRIVDDAIVQLNASYLMLVDCLIEADTNGVWVDDGSPSLAEWVTARYRMTRHTGRTLAKIALVLPGLPQIRAAFAAGRLSWDQLRAVITIATPETDAELVATAPDLEPSVIRAQTRNVDDKQATEARESRYVTYEFSDDKPVFEMHVVLPDDEGATFITALTRKAGQVDLDPYDGSCPEHGVRLADALIQMGSETLAADTDHDRATLIVETTLEALQDLHNAPQATIGDGTTIPEGTTISYETLRRLACDARIQLVVADATSGVIGIGRTARNIPTWLTRITRTRDQGCRFPGCKRTLWLHIHHIVHWADGGPTDLNNLITLCGYHHRLIHHDGWTIKGDPNGEIIWITKWGTIFERHPTFAGIDAIQNYLANPPPITPPLRRTA